MYRQIKDAAQAALDLQNKNFMDETLRNIVLMCDQVLGEVEMNVQIGDGPTVDAGDGLSSLSITSSEPKVDAPVSVKIGTSSASPAIRRRAARNDR